MRLYQIKKVEYYTLTNEIIDHLKHAGCPLNIDQRREVCDFYEYRKGLFEYKNTPMIANSFWWRLTTPLLCIAILLATVFMPIKWMITGKWYYEFSEKNIFVKWSKKVGI